MRSLLIFTFMIAALCVAEESSVPKAADPATKAAEPATQAAEAQATKAEMPKFPLQSEWFSHVADQLPDEKSYGDVDEAQQIEMHAMEDIFVALKNSTDEHLKKNVREIENKMSFKTLMREAEKYRGSVIQLRGLLENFERFPIPDNQSGVNAPYRGQISNISGHIFSFLSIEKPSQELLKRPVRLTGIFLKRYAYKNRLAGEKLTWTPLVLVKSVEPFSEAQAATDSSMSKTTKLFIAIFVIGVFVRIVYRMNKLKSRAAAGNPFTKTKNRLAARKAEKEARAKTDPPPKPIPPKAEPEA
ncbi:MAG TPA: hypothetical protein VEK08_26095 [Planctomycetota bacterium]|nr:hypothetical protein [Planctomycetota bacterium]